MSWQDILLAICNLAFVIALIPALRAVEKPAARTCWSTAVALMGIGVVNLSLHLWFGAITVLISAGEWAILWTQAKKRATLA